jgi:hypothetical protein
MKRKTLVFTAAALFAAVAVCYAAGDAFMGTWKLNEAKSKIGAGMPKNSLVVYAAAGDSVKITVDGTNADGTPLHSEWTGNFDGKDYAITGDPTADMRSYEMVDDHTLSLTSKKGGKVSGTTRVVVATDGKSRTVTSTGTDANGMKTSATYFYDKQ